MVLMAPFIFGDEFGICLFNWGAVKFIEFLSAMILILKWKQIDMWLGEYLTIKM